MCNFFILLSYYIPNYHYFGQPSIDICGFYHNWLNTEFYYLELFLMLFVYIKTSRQNKIFLFINVNNNDCHQRKTTCTLYIYKKQDKYQNVHIYKQEVRQFVLRFFSQKSRHFTLRDFSCFFKNWHVYMYKKHDTLRYVTFLYTKIPTLQKISRQFASCFYIQKAWLNSRTSDRKSVVS